MAHEATTWAYETPIQNVAQKFVLVALADMADQAYSCFPGQDKLASMTGASLRTVQRALFELEAMGLIRREERRRKDGYRTSDRYFLNVGSRPSHPSESHTSESHLTDSHMTSCPISPDTLSDLTRQSVRYIEEELPVELLEEPPVVLPDEFEAFWQAYPRKVAKPQARNAFTRALKRASGAVIVSGARVYAADPNLPEREFIPHPATWLNGDRWGDEALPPRRGTARPNAAAQRQAENLALVERMAALDAARMKGLTV